MQTILPNCQTFLIPHISFLYIFFFVFLLLSGSVNEITVESGESNCVQTAWNASHNNLASTNFVLSIDFPLKGILSSPFFCLFFSLFLALVVRRVDIFL